MIEPGNGTMTAPRFSIFLEFLYFTDRLEFLDNAHSVNLEKQENSWLCAK